MRCLTFSVILHVFLVLLAGSYVIYQRYADPSDFEAPEGGGGLVQEDLSSQPPVSPLRADTSAFNPAPAVDVPSANAIVTTAASGSALLSSLTFQSVTLQPNGKTVAYATTAQPVHKPLAKATATSGLGLAGAIPATMAGRRSGAARMVMMQRLGGKPTSERAVISGLRWLKQHQNPSGSWAEPNPPQFESGMTGLALLCFLGHGETPGSPEYGATVKAALDWTLAGAAKYDGRLSQEGAIGQTGVYAHGINTYALAEYFSMTGDAQVQEALLRAVGYIIDGQNPGGGWLYGYAMGPDADTSVSGWQIQALKAAYLTGLKIPGLNGALNTSMTNLERVQGAHGGFGYRTPDDYYPLAGVGVLCAHFWRGRTDPMVRTGIDFILEQTEKNFPVDYNGDEANLYAWYYDTEACLMVGGKAWQKWNGWFQDQIVNHQSADGSWPPTKAHGPGPQQDEGAFGPVYRTTLCILMLESYYRYLPTNR
jgi:hypothetical protein